MDASFAPQYIFLLKSICIMSQIPLHGSIFSMFLTEKIKSRAVRKPLPSHQEHCLAPRNRYAASLRPETVTIPQREDPLLVNYWHAMTFLLQVNIIWMVCESSPSMRRAAGRVDHWDELSIEQGENTVRISPEWFPDEGNWNQFPIPRNWWFPDIRKWFPGE